jgi:site-specific recombinase XerD
MLFAGATARKESILERTHESAAALVASAAGPLCGHLPRFVDSLIRQQYVPAVVYVKALHAVAFDRWLARQRVALADLAEHHVAGFGRRRRRCRGSIRPETRKRERFDLVHLLRYLRTVGACPQAPRMDTPVANLAAAYERHLRHVQGLAEASVERYSDVARQFLVQRFDKAEVDLSIVSPIDVIEFVRRQANRLTPPAAKCVVNALRSFLRYAQFRGDVAQELVAAVPAVAAWTTTPKLPKAIAPEHAQRAIASCDLGTAVGLRDRAVLLLLARLGLRAGEIIALQLEDCDWDQGQLRVRGKGGRFGVLPMPVDVGQAIAAYLQRGRPSAEDRHLFLRTTAPISGLQPGGDGIGSIVRYALRRAGIDAPHRGSHQFRHALAVRMLQDGASLAEIAEVLRHRSPQSTSLYARVDLQALRSLALPWPGGVR